MESRLLADKNPLPLVISPEKERETSVECLVDWIDRERDELEGNIRRHGALLFRGFRVAETAAFERFCLGFASPLLGYVGGHSPRTQVEGRVFTSTEYPAQLSIPLHNEMSYARDWPRLLFFWSKAPADSGGETPLADSRRMLEAIDEEVVERFRSRGVLYIENLHDGFGPGKSWSQTFETDDREEVEARCRERDIEFEWQEGLLHLRRRRPAVADHPATGETVWFNQAHLWHVSSLPERTRKGLLRMMSEEELPQHVWFGDGTPIADSDIEQIRRAGDRCQVAFPWQADDLLVVDNVLSAHGRRPFSGPRRLLVAMA